MKKTVITETTTIAPETFFRIDEKSNAIDYLHRAAQFSYEIATDEFACKWFVIALHGAAYHFMLLALQRSDLSGIWTEPEIRDANGRIDKSNKKIVSFHEAFKRIRNPSRMSQFVGSKHLMATPDHYMAIRRLNDDLRNEFIHFHPRGWSVQHAYIAEIVPAIGAIIEFLAFESNNILLGENQKQGIKKDLSILKQIAIN